MEQRSSPTLQEIRNQSPGVDTQIQKIALKSIADHNMIIVIVHTLPVSLNPTNPAIGSVHEESGTNYEAVEAEKVRIRAPFSVTDTVTKTVFPHYRSESELILIFKSSITITNSSLEPLFLVDSRLLTGIGSLH